MRRALILALLSAVAICANLQDIYDSEVITPFEVIAYRDRETLECTDVVYRKAQIYRGLPPQGHEDIVVTEHGDERLQFIHQDDDIVKSRGESFCRAQIWSEPQEFGNSHQQNSRGLNDQEVFDYPETGPIPATVITSSSKINLPLEVQPLIISGPSRNRVDLVFFSDGYTESEKTKFIDDALRLALDISYNQTFNTVRPLMNFWAAFTPSGESGIGVGGQPKDTPFGLYRDGTELRGVYYSKPKVARQACFSLHDRCDYPILLGNDPLYGGLGGTFTVITSSLANGALVLRHELGHSVIDVGEEYDGGFAYFGVNAAHNVSTTKAVPWSHWLNEDSDAQEEEVRIERSVMPMQAYPWTMLNTSAAWSTKFESAGTYARHVVRFSLSGLPEKDDLLIELDGEALEWAPRPDLGVDRWHYDIHRNATLSGGEHELNFTLKNKDRQGIAQLCSAEILEFGDESEFVSTPGHYGAYPTYSETNETSYRPTNEDCLMRVVTAASFCKVCLEGLWLSLLRRVNLIDTVSNGCDWIDSSESTLPQSPDKVVSEAEVKGHWKRSFGLDLVPFAQFRDDAGIGATESYAITWTKDGQVLDQFTNSIRVEMDDEDALGRYTVDVQLTTPEVRVDRDGLLGTNLTWTINRSCWNWHEQTDV